MNEERALTSVGESSVASVDAELAVYEGMLKMAGHLVQSGLLPGAIKSAPAALAVMLTGRELGWAPMKSFRLIHIIDGKPTIASDGLMGIVNQWCRNVAGDAFVRVTESTNELCTVEYKRPEWSGSQAITYTIDDAKRAGLLGKKNWSQYPRDMLRARAQAVACRMGFTDVVGGFYDPDELNATAEIHEVPRRADRSVEVTGTVVDQDGDAKRRESIQRSLHGWATNASISHEELSALTRHYANGGFASMSDIPLETLSDVATRIRSTFKEDPGGLKAFARELIGAGDESRIVDAEFTTAPDPQAAAVNQEQQSEDPRKQAVKELWRMANGTWGLSKEQLDEVAVALTENHLEDLDAAGITGLYRRLVVMSPEERESTIAAARAA